MIDEMATTETQAETVEETFDLDAAVTAYIARQDQQKAADEEEHERRQREIRERGCTEIWERVCDAMPDASLRAAFGMSEPVWDEEAGYPVVKAHMQGRDYIVSRWGDGFRIVGVDYPRIEQYCGQSDSLFAALIRTAAEARRLAAVVVQKEAELYGDDHVQTTKAAPAKTWEPQALGSDGYRTTYLLHVDTGCGSLTQHALTVAEIAPSGDVTLSQLFPGRLSHFGAGEGPLKPVVEYRLSGAQLRALWPLWQQVTATSQEELAKTQATDAEAPF